MQQEVIEENMAYEPPVRSYDDLFPALPESSQLNEATTNNFMGKCNHKMRLGTSTITLVFRVPFKERKLDHSEKFGEGESVQTCANIMKDTGAHIEISSGKDQSLTFLVIGKKSEVLEARRKILAHFQTQASRQIAIPKEHHRWILGKNGDRLKDLEKSTATKISVPTKSDPSEIITITGTKDGIEKAEHEIKVTSDEQSKKAFERITVPKIYHPFVVGANNENLIAMTAETGAKINVPPPSSTKDEIVIAGEKEGVLKAKAKVEAIYQDMHKKCTTVSVEVPKPQHKYVIGPRGSTIQEILRETGVSVEMPPSDSSTGTITLRGPQDKLGQALNKVYEKANSVRSSDVDAPAWIHKYIIGRKGAVIKELCQNLLKVHVEFTDKEDKIQIEGPPEEVETAQQRIEERTREILSTYTFTEIHVDPKYYKHIIGKNGANVNRLKDETQAIINIDESGLIRIEGVAQGVEKVKQELEDMVKKLENEKEKDVIIEQRYYRWIIGAKGENIKDIREKFNQVQINFPSPNDRRDVVKIRGPKDDVDKCSKYLQKIVKELNESSYQIVVPIYKQFQKYVTEKTGAAKIRKIKEDTQTKIELPGKGDKSNAITITGQKKNVQEAKEMIKQIQDEEETIVTEEITIDPQFYNSLIGTKGKLIHSIMEDCGGVTIKFPSAESKSDKVTIRGPKEDVERAKQQLLDLANEKQLSSYTAEVRAKPQHHKFLIGKDGANIKQIRVSTGARVVFPASNDEDRELITIIGKKEAVEMAKEKLEARIKRIDNITESEMTVDRKHHKHFVARRGEVLHMISDECGGVMISFPRSGVQSDKVVLKGSKECIEAAKVRINDIVADRDSRITIDCVIPQQHHRTVMGAKGHKVQGIAADFDVQIKFPDKNNTEEYQQDASVHHYMTNGDLNADQVRQCDVIRITGKEDNCWKAYQALKDLIPVKLDVEVPFDLHRSIIGQKGRDVKELMDRFDVHIVLSAAEDREDKITITGALTNVEMAREAVLARVAKLAAERELKSFEQKIEVNPEYHPKIIGKRGIVITKIRKEHDVLINFPKKGDPEEHVITITGYEENVHRAKEAIMQIVNELSDMVKIHVSLDSRVHSRLIGARGRNIRQIMEQYKVDIKFPRVDDPDPNLVIISGLEDNVLEAKDHLLNLEEEYMQDVTDMELTASYRPKTDIQGSPIMNESDNRDNNGFIVQGGPWEQDQQQQQRNIAPNTASVTEFPSFGGRNLEEPQSMPAPTVWGPRR